MRKEGFGYVLTRSYTCFLTACRSPNGFLRNPVKSVIRTSNLYSRGSRRFLQYIILTWRPGFTFPVGPCMNTHLCKVILQGKYKNTPPSQIFFFLFGTTGSELSFKTSYIITIWLQKGFLSKGPCWCPQNCSQVGEKSSDISLFQVTPAWL